MARKEKIDNAILKRFTRQESSRPINTRVKRRFFLIVCEGTKTEPTYFEGLRENLPIGLIGIVEFEVEGTGHNTQTVIQDALKAKARIEQQGRVIDEVWAVFDRDSFPEEHFNNAIFKGQEQNVHCAWTNEAFELWYLLHFHFFQHGMSRMDYKRVIEREVSKKLGTSFIYEKNRKDMYKLLGQYGNQEQAIIWAEKLEIPFAGRTDYANHNPCTKVYELVTRILHPEKLENETMTEYLQRRRTGIRK